MNTKNIKTILFDSGRVLNHPRTGHWFIPPNFYKYVDEKIFKSLDKKEIEAAFSKANEYINDISMILTEEEELEHFIKFYKIFSDELSELKLNKGDIVNIARDTVCNDDKFFFHEDVFQMIPKLSETYKLGVVSDTWPSLERVFKNVGLRKYFSTFVMSSVLGVTKPHELMFNTALDEVNMEKDEVLFIDDNIRNVKGAIDLGIDSILLIREKGYINDSQYTCVGDLIELEELLRK